jgi:beta-xylosidase
LTPPLKPVSLHKALQNILLFLLCFIFFTKCNTSIDLITNPICDGFYADPSIVKYNDTYYIYATIDPWGGEELGVLESKDFINWEQRHIDWPTKKACTSETSGDAMVWAPSVINAGNGRFYMYISVGSEIWAGVSDHPLGPWKNAKDDNSPLIHRNYFPGYHMIDAQCFMDNDGRIYLYWGSGLNWVKGACFVVELEGDMVTFKSEPRNITPPNYFEGPFMFKKYGIYYLMYSDGKAIDATYKIRYSTGKTPYGPWQEGKNSPILSTSPDSTTYGPGHHSVFVENNQAYVLYHRIYPQEKELVLRQLCIDSLNFDNHGNILKVNPKGVASFVKN